MAATQPGAPGGPGRGGRIAAAIRRRPALALAGIGGAVVVVVALARRHAAAAAAQGSTGAPVVFPGAGGGGTQGGPSPSAGLETQMQSLQNLLNREERQIRQLQRKPGRQKTDRQRARLHPQGGLAPWPGRRGGGTSRTGGRIR